ncbi:D-3-phosphoglycerate dehydrogenase-like [Anneissia japonica]|uniref:D-3-phosphoglycerate dehydrogenase-like n=1 Tax=Anneissia japonica TaxID=1529436 RepID=UPI001425759F|nr:D-3-phosphoglycerate dehydrogenase-like [Anneissia japonica]
MVLSLKKVLISDALSPLCAQVLEANGIIVETKTKLSKEELIAEIPNYDGLIVRSATKVTADVIDAATNLKIIGRAGTGVDNIDIPAASRKGIIVMNTPGGNTISAVEHTCAMMCALARHIPQAHMSMREGRWDRKLYMGTELQGKTLAIVGLGRIGREVATRMQSFGMKTIGFDPLVSAEEAEEFNVKWLTVDEIWPLADYITVHVPLIPPTKGMLNDTTFAKCKKGVRVLNIARGGIYEEEAIIRALDSGQCGGAALDVFMEEPPKNKKLTQHPKVIMTPHLGASTEEAQIRVAEEIAQQFVDATNGKSLFGHINAQALSNALQPQTLPLVSLGKALGLLATSIAGPLKTDTKVQVITYGDSLKDAGKYLSAAVLAGILQTQSSANVNLVNAPVLAKEGGLQTATEHVEKAPSNLSSAVSVVATVGGVSCKLSGTIMGCTPVLCEVDGATFQGPAVLAGHLLLYKTQGAAAEVLASFSGAGANQILSFTSTCGGGEGSWGYLQLVSPLPNPESLNGRATSITQLSC